MSNLSQDSAENERARDPDAGRCRATADSYRDPRGECHCTGDPDRGGKRYDRSDDGGDFRGKPHRRGDSGCYACGEHGRTTGAAIRSRGANGLHGLSRHGS